MVTFLEEREYQAAHKRLHWFQLRANFKFQTEEASVEASNLSDEEKNNCFDILLQNYDQDIKQAEAEYDKALDKIRPWKKLRRER